MEEKKVVFYDPKKGVDFIKVGLSGVVFPTNHTSSRVSNGRVAYTSTIISVGENGEFETLNSLYKPIKE